jgi:tRNA-2-methylthio-N6-dimethylallyladenosine synthase
VRAGDVVQVHVTYAAPHHLIADGTPVSHRRTRGGDAWEALQDKGMPAMPSASPAVGLGMPGIGVPATA